LQVKIWEEFPLLLSNICIVILRRVGSHEGDVQELGLTRFLEAPEVCFTSEIESHAPFICNRHHFRLRR
jgi:hypothetical protein